MALTIALIAYFVVKLKSEDQSVFLPGHSTDGHYQIELDCQACHTPMMGVKEQACYDCHSADLEAADDSHPKKKFTDPRNADRIAKLDARKCVTCHIEHRADQTHAMGLTLPEDYCFHCHQEIAEERPSHEGYDFYSCATAGCHNFHDNTALYEDFLAKHIGESDFKPEAVLPKRNLQSRLVRDEIIAFLKPLESSAADAPRAELALESESHNDWLTTAHAKAGINCSDCHEVEEETGTKQWTQSVSHEVCSQCHKTETSGWLQGKHGMRIAQGLSPMTPSQARLPMKIESHTTSLSCTSCHSAHRFDTRQAAVNSCVQCHDDQHTRNYFNSPHHELWLAQTKDPSGENSGVSCATCHLPRLEQSRGDEKWVEVVHNQNWNLEPNEKMIRSVCLNCHGLGFSIDALADPNLIQNNFRGQPAKHIESLDLVERRLAESRN